jgi:hypothetical protein
VILADGVSRALEQNVDPGGAGIESLMRYCSFPLRFTGKTRRPLNVFLAMFISLLKFV